MFSKKRSKLPICCDSYINIYNKCNIGCEMCKFNQNVKGIRKMYNDYDNYKNQKVLFCYSVDPYALEDYSFVESVITKLHQNNCQIVFLTRKSKCLLKQLRLFNREDILGISISENCSKNSNIQKIKDFLIEAKKNNLKTWISLEPVLTAKFANEIIKELKDYTNFIRVGKDDLLDYNWQTIQREIGLYENVYVKE